MKTLQSSILYSTMWAATDHKIHGLDHFTDFGSWIGSFLESANVIAHHGFFFI